jgi:hypothetical protein
MAARARVLVVRLVVAATAVLGAWEMQWTVFACGADARVTTRAGHALEDVRAVRKGLPSRRTKAEDLRARRRQREGHQEEQCPEAAHFVPQA